MEGIVLDVLREKIDDNGLIVDAIETRVKTEQSLAGLLEIVDEEFRQMRDGAERYREDADALIAEGKLTGIGLYARQETA